VLLIPKSNLLAFEVATVVVIIVLLVPTIWLGIDVNNMGLPPPV
jgi:hypothetical protein